MRTWLARCLLCLCALTIHAASALACTPGPIPTKEQRNLWFCKNDGDTAIVSTAKHPFWVDDDGRWTDAADLEIGDQLLAADGSRSEVVETRRFDAVQRVHNLTVDGIHTYFVVAGSEPILVHNCGDLDALSAAGRVADRNGLTAAGRAAQKHGAGTGARAGNGFPTPPTGAANLNEFGQNLLDDLLTAPNTATRTFTQPGYGQVTEFWGPNYGARFGPNGEFIGFL